MSWQALNWAGKQIVGHAHSKAILMHLANFADEQGSCFPSHERLAAITEVSVRTVQDCVKRLEAEGYVDARRERREDGRLGLTRYRLCLDRPANRRAAEAKPPEAASGYDHRQSPQEPPEAGAATTGSSFRSEPSEESPEEPPDERGGRARDDEKIPDRERLERLKASHPNVSHDSPAAIEAAWCALTRAERREAVNKFDAWISERGARKAIAGLPVYLAEKRFTMVKAVTNLADEPPKFTGPFDRMWWHLFFDFVGRNRDEFASRDSPASSFLRRRLGFTRNYGGGWPLDALDATEVAARAAEEMRSIPKEGDECRRWRKSLAAFGVELPLPDKVGWIFVPTEDWVASERTDLSTASQ